MPPFKLPPPPPPDDPAAGDPTNPEGAIKTRLDLDAHVHSRDVVTPVEIPLTHRVDTLIAAKHRGYMEADRRCEERLEGAHARGWRWGAIAGATGGIVVFIAGILLYRLLRP